MSPASLLLGPLVGGLSHNRANIWCRADGPSSMHVWLAAQPDVSDAAWAGTTKLLEENGCAGVLSLKKLKPNTTYYYAVSLLKTCPPASDFHAFTTFPSPATKRSFTFMFGSCYLPPDEHGGQTLDELHRRVTTDSLRFGLMIGDQIYADYVKHNGLGRVAVTLDEYRSVYARTWSRPAMQSLLPDLPMFMILDDHEVDNDWRWRDINRLWGEISIVDRILRWFQGYPPEERHLSPERVRAALKANDEHQSIHAPKLLLPLQNDAKGEYIFQSHDPGSLAYTFYFGGAALFVMDTRTMRVVGKKPTMLGEGQWHVLEEWLKKVNKKYPIKFIVSSCSILHTIWFDVVNDRWSGFPDERERFLKLLAENEITGVRILTGDLHSGHAVTAELKCPSGRHIPIAEFCASPFEQKGNWMGFAYVRARSKWLTRQRRSFYHAHPNFGIVNVDFEAPEPRVTFTLNYNDKTWESESLTA